MTESVQSLFHCPGDPQPVSRAVHLARMASGHERCRECLHRSESGSLSGRLARSLGSAARRSPESMIADEGIRGPYLNEFTRERMTTLVERIVTALVENQLADPACPAAGLRILVGHDARASSPDLMVGVVIALRRWGCEIADLCQLSRAAFDFAVDRFRPDLGLYVTGGVAPGTWNGLDILDGNGLPWSRADRLGLLNAPGPTPPRRASGHPGAYRPVEISTEFAASMQGHFHAIRPLRLVIHCEDPLTWNTLSQLLEATPCVVHLRTGPTGREPEERLHHLAEAIRERHADVGFLIAADGRGCTIVDERGLAFGTAETCRLLLRADETGPERLSPCLSNGDQALSEAELLARQQHRKFPLATDNRGRYWFLDETPRCAAVLTLAKALRTFSLTDAPVSAWRAATG